MNARTTGWRLVALDLDLTGDMPVLRGRYRGLGGITASGKTVAVSQAIDAGEVAHVVDEMRSRGPAGTIQGPGGSERVKGGVE